MTKGKLVLGLIIGIFMMIFMLNSCERIDAGHVGVKVNLYGTGSFQLTFNIKNIRKQKMLITLL
jgi:hypothetical protein